MPYECENHALGTARHCPGCCREQISDLNTALKQCVKALIAAQKEIARGGHADRWKTIHGYIEPALEQAKKARG